MNKSFDTVTILVVDDVSANRKLLHKILDIIIDCVVIEADSGARAIEICKSSMPDLILMDINMPDVDGYHATVAIKELVGSSYIPIIFVTALSEETSMSQALSCGGDDFISKPFNARVLESKINAHLRIKELNQQLLQKNEHLIYEQGLMEKFFDKALTRSFLDKRIIKYHMSSMSAFNGDILFIQKTTDDRVYVLVGDFTGHGLSAAMGTLPVAMVFFKMAEKGIESNHLVREINLQLNMLLPSGMFFAASFIELDCKQHHMKIWTGGMPGIYWLGKSGELKGEIKSKNMPLGILKDADFNDEMESYPTEFGDNIYLYSDGIIEASKAGEMFGSHRLKDTLLNNKENRFDKVLSVFNEFTGDEAQSDDVTLIELTCADIA